MSLSEAARKIAQRVHLEAQLIPIAGTVRIKGSEPISGYNLAMHVANLLDALGRCEVSIYGYLCDQPPEATVRTDTMPHVADSPTDLVERWRERVPKPLTPDDHGYLLDGDQR